MGKLAGKIGLNAKGSVRVELLHSQYVAGGMLQGVVYVNIHKPVLSQALVVSVIGKEQASWTVRSGKSSHTRKVSELVLNQKILLMTLPTQFEPGNYVYPFQCLLSPELPGILWIYRSNWVTKKMDLTVSVKYSVEARLEVPGVFGADLSSKLKGVCIYAKPLTGIFYPPVKASKTKNVHLLAVLSQGQCHVAAELDSQVLRPGAQAHVTATIRNETSRSMRKISVQLIQTISVCGDDFSRTICEREYRGLDAGEELNNARFALAIVEATDPKPVPPSTAASLSVFAVHYMLRIKCRFAFCHSVVVEFPVVVASESIGVRIGPVMPRA